MTDTRGIKPYNWCSTTYFLFIPWNKPFRMVDWFYFLKFLLLAKHYIHEKSALKCCAKLYTVNTDFHVSLITAVRGIGIFINDFGLMVIFITIREGPHQKVKACM